VFLHHLLPQTALQRTYSMSSLSKRQILLPKMSGVGLVPPQKFPLIFQFFIFLREAWHKFSCPDSLSNNGGSVRSNLTTNSFHKSLDDYEPLDVEFLPGKDTKLPFEEKYKEDFQIVRDKKSHHSFLMKIVFFFFILFLTLPFFLR